MPPKPKRQMKKLSKALEECHIASGEPVECGIGSGEPAKCGIESGEPAKCGIESGEPTKCGIASGKPAECGMASDEPAGVTPEGTVFDDSINPQFISKWPKLKPKRVPNIFLHKPADFQQHVQKLLSMGIKFNQPYLSTRYTKIKCPTMNDHRALTQYFEKKQLPFNTFGNPAKRKMKVVIRGLPKDIDLIALKSELKSFSIPIVRVHKMKILETVKQRRTLVLAVVPYNDDGLKLLQAQKIMGHDVELEPPYPKTKQCHRCQMWGHTQRYCHGQVKCVKCAGEHFSKKCERDPDKEPPKCANCEGDHTANYRKCPCCPDSSEHKFSQLVKSLEKKAQQESAAGLVTLENCDTLYKNISYEPDYEIQTYMM